MFSWNETPIIKINTEIQSYRVLYFPLCLCISVLRFLQELSDSVGCSYQFLVLDDASAGEDVEDEGDGGQNSGELHFEMAILCFRLVGVDKVGTQ